MTEIEAHRLVDEIRGFLSPQERALLDQRLKLGNMDMFQFLDVTIDGIPKPEEPASDFHISLESNVIAQAISTSLRFRIGEPSWKISRYIGELITIGMEAEKDTIQD